MKRAILYQELGEKRVRCQTCWHFCILEPNSLGKCQVKENKFGTLYSLVYGKVKSINIEPMEKIGFFHFFPGKEALSLTTLGTNWKEPALRGRSPIFVRKAEGAIILPEKIVKTALNYKLKIIAFKGEPTVAFNFVLEIMKLAKKEDLSNIWFSNGYFSKEALELFGPLLSAINITLQTLNGKTYRKLFGIKLKPILDNLIEIKKRKIHLEVSTFLIPEILGKDFREIARFIKKYLGKETPWHILRFSPEISWQMKRYLETPAEEVQRACDIGIEEGLFYVYGGNAIGLSSEDTYCPRCHQKMIDRTGYIIERKDKNGKCSNCNENLHIKE